MPILLVFQQRVTDFIRCVLETKEDVNAIVADVAKPRQPEQATVSTDRLLDAKGLADMLGVSREEVEHMQVQGAPCIDVVGRVRFQFSEVLTWLRSRRKHLRAVD